MWGTSKTRLPQGPENKVKYIETSTQQKENRECGQTSPKVVSEELNIDIKAHVDQACLWMLLMGPMKAHDLKNARQPN